VALISLGDIDDNAEDGGDGDANAGISAGISDDYLWRTEFVEILSSLEVQLKEKNTTIMNERAIMITDQRKERRKPPLFLSRI
jgi:hypothetical protein